MRTKNLSILLILDGFLFTSIVFLAQVPYILLGVYILGTAALFYKKKDDWPFFVAVTLVGMVVELFCVHGGVFHYAYPNWGGAPFWVYFMWGVAGLSAFRLGALFGK